MAEARPSGVIGLNKAGPRVAREGGALSLVTGLSQHNTFGNGDGQVILHPQGPPGPEARHVFGEGTSRVHFQGKAGGLRHREGPEN